MAHRDEDEWLDQLSKEMERLAGEMAGAGLKPARSRGWSPRVDVFETESHVVLKVELAGVQPDKVTLHYNASKNSLTFKGWRYDENPFPNERQVAHKIEIDYGEFWREVALPDVPLDVEQVRAGFTNGLLMLTVPKSDAPAKPIVVKRTITIQKL
ncbi:MAG TPA: Hsp20/alpha crystallin family protein [Fimbriimonadaceae bacterium]|nr:Hsp20/alpha crystallin family protein [Fimbriimonadaceae bacterium]